MKFCDERIQKHLMNGGKIKNNDIVLIICKDGKIYEKSNNSLFNYSLDKTDLISDDWEIVEPEYDWDKIIKDKVLCVFSDFGDYKNFDISMLSRYGFDGFYTNENLKYELCKPFNPAEFNIIKDLKEYEK